MSFRSGRGQSQISLGWGYFLNPWWRVRVSFSTNLDAPECKRRLAQGTTLWPESRVGRAWFSLADLSLRRVTLYSNSFKPYAQCRFRAAGAGTDVEVTLAMPLSARIFLGAWFGIAGVLILATAWESLSRLDLHGLATLPYGLMFPVFGLGVCAAGRVLARQDPSFLLSYIGDRLGSSPT